jgi:hypothetical protein
LLILYNIVHFVGVVLYKFLFVYNN